MWIAQLVQFNLLTQYVEYISRSRKHRGWTKTKKCHKFISKRRTTSFNISFIISILLLHPTFLWWHVPLLRNFTFFPCEAQELIALLSCNSWEDQRQPLGKTRLGSEEFRLVSSFVLLEVSSAPSKIPLHVFVAV